MSTTRPPAFDERYTASSEASRRGAHRSRPSALSAMLPLVAGAVLVALVVGGAWTFLTNRGSDGGGSGSVAAAPTSTPAASASGKPSDTAADTRATPSTTPDGTGSASASATVDEDAELVVLNSIRSQGLAARVAADLKDEGWTVARTGNSNQRNLETTRVYYAKSREQATADAVVDDLGFGEAVKSAGNAAAGITVVLGNDAL